MPKAKTDGQARAAARKRDFATIVYPESAPQDWLNRLKDAHVQAFVSPLHDRDVNPDGELKKPHYHVLVMYDSPKNFDSQVAPLFEEIGAVGRENVASQRGYARYLCHLDNPEKAQYDRSDVIAIGGAEYSEVVKSQADDERMIAEIFAFIDENNVYDYFQFLKYAWQNKPDWFRLTVNRKSVTVRDMIKSKAWSDGVVNVFDIDKVDYATGEILERRRSDVQSED